MAKTEEKVRSFFPKWCEKNTPNIYIKGKQCEML